MHPFHNQRRRTAAAILLLSGVSTVQAATLTVYRDGRTLRSPGSVQAAKSLAYCQANPGVFMQLTDALVTPGGSPVRVTEGSAASVQVQLTLSAYCGLALPVNPAAVATVEVDYGVLTGGSATPGSDYAGGIVATARFSNVAVYTNPQVQTLIVNVPTIDDNVVEDAESFGVGLLGGGVLELGGATPEVAAVTADGSAIATVQIDDNDRTPIGPGTATLLAGDPVANDLARALDQICDAPLQDAGLLSQCDFLRQRLRAGDAAGAAAVLRALAPEEQATQSSSVVEIRSGSQTERVQNRLAALRGGALRQSTSTDLSLTIRDASGIPLLLQLQDPADTGGGLFDQRLSGFLAADLGRGDRDVRPRESGFEYDRFGATGGLDYRFSERFVAGAALGYNRFEADLDQAGGSLDASIRALTVYASFAPTPAAYLEGSIGIADFSFDQSRRISYNVAGRSLDRLAVSDFDAEQLIATSAVGYVWALGEWSLTPSLNAEWSRTDTDSFAETGASELNLFIRGQDTYSLLTTGRLHLSRNISLNSGVWVPYASLSFMHEGRNENRPSEVRFLADRSGTRIFIGTEEPDTRYGMAGAGVNWLLPNGVQLYLDYRRSFGLEAFSLNAFSLGARLEF